MERHPIAADLEAELVGRHLGLRGELRRDNAHALLLWLDGCTTIERLELDEFDIADGIAATEAINAVRRLLARQPHLLIHGAPQLLAHNLYRSGLLEGGRITLEAMREDEAYG
jgi:hypothetical protein